MDDRGASDRSVDVPGVTVATTADARADALAVRDEVFVEGQDVPPDLEVDEHDDDPATTHFLARDGGGAGADARPGTPVGAARLRPYGDDGVGKVERVAVREHRRGEGWGRRLMEAVERIARERGFERLRLDSQTHAVGFYRHLDYAVVDDEPFLDAGIPHRAMAKEL